jgi:hypothetical protein
VNDLLAFLNARLDEEEAQARDLIESEAASASWEEMTSGVLVTGPSTFDDTWDGTHVIGDSRISRFIADHDPARVLREVAAKRVIIAELNADTQADDRYRSAITFAVECIAAACSGWPDYRDEWKP